MLRILTWNANTGFDKMPSKDVASFTPDTSSSLHPCTSGPAKRKRSFDASVGSPIEKHAVKALPAAEMSAQTHPKLMSPPQDSQAVQSSTTLPVEAASQLPTPESIDHVMIDAQSTPISDEAVKSKEEAQLATMRQTISSQLSLEILIKHRELRFIDQELAKCQIALEQLRRCTEIPFPAMQPPSENVSNGTGAALKKSSGTKAARSPAPWGVTDGPYTRHYAHWLLHDSHFDGGEREMVGPATLGSTPFVGRSTRGHFTDFAQMVGKTSRSQRALNHASLPNGFAEPKQKPTGPMILKRKSDGKMVKLVCPDCGRHDFGSAQGFINHCRIGHQRNYASHDAAAEGCGQPMDAEEVAAVKDTQTESLPQTPVVFSTTPVVASATSSSVQPMIRSAHLLPKDSAAKPLLRGGFVPKSNRKSKKSKSSSIKSLPQCSSTPHLSAFIQDRGMEMNLSELVAEAQSKTEADEHVEEVDEDMEIDSPIESTGGNRRHPHVAGRKKPMKSSGKAIMSQSRREEQKSFSSINTSHDDAQVEGLMSLLPSPTNDSTQAPSLIDDDEEMEPQSPPSSDEMDETDVHFHVRDDDHPEEGHEIRNPDLQSPPATCTTTQPPVQPPLATTTALPRPLSSKEGAHVQFIAEYPNNDGQNDRKRRRI